MPSESNSEVLSSNARRSTRARRRASIGAEVVVAVARDDDDDDARRLGEDAMSASVVLLGSVSVSVDAMNAIGAGVPKYEEPIECGQVRVLASRARCWRARCGCAR
jgi:hypothetical protein